MTPFARGLLIGAPRSGSGKTTITLGLQRAFKRRGVRVSGLKCGPDYIDPAFHAAATGRPSANLDSFAMPHDLLAHIAHEASHDSDLIIAEGSMGLFDGVRAPSGRVPLGWNHPNDKNSPQSNMLEHDLYHKAAHTFADHALGRSGASADLAAHFGWPVVLVIDVSGQAQSAAAVALGCKLYDPRITIAGVILNKVASERHRKLVSDGMERIGLKIFGALPREASLILPERHLGLVQAGETEDLHARLDALAAAIEAAVDLDSVASAAAATQMPVPQQTLPFLQPPAQRIALAQDAAFSFLYPHILSGWQAQGAEIFTFSPLADEGPHQDCDACWLPGGYPELHAGRLAAAQSFRNKMQAFAATKPVHGECGGYMVLGETLEDADGATHPMLGLLPVATSFAKRKLNLGYRVATLISDTPIGKAGTKLVGHEFHYAGIMRADADPASSFARICDAEGKELGLAGHRHGTVSGSFFHVIAPSAQ